MLIAEREGFEPPEVLPSTVFKTAAIDHSAISPENRPPCAAHRNVSGEDEIRTRGRIAPTSV